MKNNQTETKSKSAGRVARHLFSSRTFGFALLGLFLLSGSAWAAPSAIEGIVKDPKGRVISGAEIRIEATGGSSWNKIIKTDAKGHYVYNGLDAGTYRVSLLVNGLVKASINNVKTKLGDLTKLNFDLKATTSSQASAPAKKKPAHMVWVPAKTGTHIGGGWVEVDDNANSDNSAADNAQNVQRVDGSVLQKLQMTPSVGPSRGEPGGK